MSNSETTVPIGDWTIGSLKVYEDEKIASQRDYFLALRADDKEAIQTALITVKEDNAKIALAFEKRFDSVNEFRQQLSDQTNTFLPRLEYNAQHKALEDKVSLLIDIMNQNKGQDISMGKIYAAIGAVGAVLGIIVLLANGVFN